MEPEEFDSEDNTPKIIKRGMDFWIEEILGVSNEDETEDDECGIESEE